MDEQQITALLNEGLFGEAVARIEKLETTGSEGSFATQGIGWYGDDGSSWFKVSYSDDTAIAVQIVGSDRVYYR